MDMKCSARLRRDTECRSPQAASSPAQIHTTTSCCSAGREMPTPDQPLNIYATSLITTLWALRDSILGNQWVDASTEHLIEIPCDSYLLEHIPETFVFLWKQFFINLVIIINIEIYLDDSTNILYSTFQNFTHHVAVFWSNRKRTNMTYLYYV